MLGLSPLGLLGASLLGGVPAIGQVRNFHAVDADEPFAASVAFDLEDVDEETARVALYLEGQLNRVVPVGATRATLSGIFASNVRLENALFSESEVAPEVLGHFGADSAYVTWPYISDPDLVAVEIYRATAISGGALVSPVLVGRVGARESGSGFRVENRILARPDSGDANGRITCWGGVPVDLQVNGAFTLTITDAGAAAWSGFGQSGDIDFDRGEVVTLPLGVSVRFEDWPDDYVAGDVYTIHVGVPNFYQTPTLPEGTYYFGIRAIDSADNATPADVDDIDAITGAIKIMYEPGAATQQALAYESADGGTARVTWVDPADEDLAAVRVYTNFNIVTGELEDYIIEDVPLASVAPGDQELGITGVDALSGTLMVFVRPVDADGFENESIRLLSLKLPVTSVALGLLLGHVLLLRARPAAGGGILATWAYLRRDDPALNVRDDCSGFAYWLSMSPIDFADAPTGVVTPSSDTSPAESYQVLFESVGGHGETWYLGVRATDGDGGYGDNTDYVQVTLDAVGPTVSGPVLGVTN